MLLPSLVVLAWAFLAMLMPERPLAVASAQGTDGGVLWGFYEIPGLDRNGLRGGGGGGTTPNARLRFGSVATLDEDLKSILDRVFFETRTGFSVARTVFERGANSEPFAVLTIDGGGGEGFRDAAIPPGSTVRGVSESGAIVRGIARSGSAAGNSTLVVHYPVAGLGGGGEEEEGTDDEGSGLPVGVCSVGGNPTPVFDGCFVGPAGKIQIEIGHIEVVDVQRSEILTDAVRIVASNTTTTTTNETASIGTNPTADPSASGNGVATEEEPVVLTFDYTYDVVEGNHNGLSLATLKGDRVVPYRSTLQKYVSYYGTTNYDTLWLDAAFRGNPTPGFSFSINGNTVGTDMDLSLLDFEGRHAALRTGIVVLKLWMFVAESLEEAVSVCGVAPSGNDPAAAYRDALARWDRAVAAYAGAGPIDDRDANGDGYFLYGLVQEECKRFGTCPVSDDDYYATMAPLNRDILTALRDGREALSVGNCFMAGSDARRIAEKMTVPLVQGILRNAYELDLKDDFSGRVQGEVAAYAAAVLPLLHECSAGFAFQVYNEFVPGEAPGASYEVMRDALERSYPCMGISCPEIGGLVAEGGAGSAYRPGAGPCGVPDFDEAAKDDESPWGAAQTKRNSISSAETLIIAISIGGGILVGTLVAVGIHLHKRRGSNGQQSRALSAWFAAWDWGGRGGGWRFWKKATEPKKEAPPPPSSSSSSGKARRRGSSSGDFQKSLDASQRTSQQRQRRRNSSTEMRSSTEMSRKSGRRRRKSSMGSSSSCSSSRNSRGRRNSSLDLSSRCEGDADGDRDIDRPKQSNRKVVRSRNDSIGSASHTSKTSQTTLGKQSQNSSSLATPGSALAESSLDGDDCDYDYDDLRDDDADSFVPDDMPGFRHNNNHNSSIDDILRDYENITERDYDDGDDLEAHPV